MSTVRSSVAAHAPLSPQVAETCQLAVRRLEWLQEHSREPAVAAGPYLSVDPAPPAEEQDVGRLREVLLDEARPLFDRYRAMFALRDAGGEEAALALAEGEWGSGSRSVRLAQAPGRTQKWRNRVTRERASCPGARTPPRAFPEAGRHTCPHFPWGGRGQKGGELPEQTAVGSHRAGIRSLGVWLRDLSDLSHSCPGPQGALCRPLPGRPVVPAALRHFLSGHHWDLGHRVGVPGDAGQEHRAGWP